MQAWANRQIEITEQEIRRGGQVQREGKKTLLAHYLWRHPYRGATIASRNPSGARLCRKRQSQPPRLFAPATACSHRLWRRPNLRPSHEQTGRALRHYLGESTIRRITEGHAQKIFEIAGRPQVWPTRLGNSAVVIVEMDGGMVPIVEPDVTQPDQRKGKKLQWKEAKICLAHPQGSILKSLRYGIARLP